MWRLIEMTPGRVFSTALGLQWVGCIKLWDGAQWGECCSTGLNVPILQKTETRLLPWITQRYIMELGLHQDVSSPKTWSLPSFHWLRESYSPSSNYHQSSDPLKSQKRCPSWWEWGLAAIQQEWSSMSKGKIWHGAPACWHPGGKMMGVTVCCCCGQWGHLHPATRARPKGFNSLTPASRTS